MKKEKKKLSKYEKAKRRRKIINGIMGFIIFCALLGVASGVSTIALIMSKSDVVLDVADLNSSEVSIIYDSMGNEIAKLGKEDRINVTYDEMPQCVIDAFVSVEDSRFFEHPGFDIPRFAKAVLENIKALDFAQGGSTITMQIIKNSYFAVDTIAVRSGGGGIARKVQEIYYSLKITNLVSKEKIIELYINKVNYGANARGIQVASDYYFSKDCTELNLVEAAMLAGIVNSPNMFDPYFYPEKCQARTKVVLDLMERHGYITAEENAMASKIQVVNLLSGSRRSTITEGETIPNQAYVDTVITELEDEYDIDPYTTAVKVYTAMNPTVQQYCDDISNGKIVKFKDDYINAALSIIQNRTGLIVGICGGRNYNRVRMYNYATDSALQPGSTSKAVFTYPLGFEYGGISTSYYYTDGPITWTGSSVRIRNDANTYYGQISVQRAFRSSYNIPAVLTLRMVRQNISDAKIKDYLRSIGFSETTVSGFNEQFAIGGMNFLASPMQMAGGLSAMLSGGVYTQPHTITKIEFINSTKEPITSKFEGNRVISQGAAWLVSQLMYINTNPQLATENDLTSAGAYDVLGRSYPTYAKTGTTSLPDNYVKKYNINRNCAKDVWLLCGTDDYAMACWMGYDYEKGSNAQTHLTPADRNKAPQFTIIINALNLLEKTFGKPKNTNPQPADVVQIAHIRGLYPYTSLPTYADKKYQTEGLILSKFAEVLPYESTATISSVTELNVTVNADQSLDIRFSPYPDESKLTEPSHKMRLSYGKESWNVTKVYDPGFIDGHIQYHVVIRNSTGDVIEHLTPETNELTWTPAKKYTSNTSLTVSVYYKYTAAPVQSNTLLKTVYIRGYVPEPVPVDPPVTPVVEGE